MTDAVNPAENGQTNASQSIPLNTPVKMALLTATSFGVGLASTFYNAAAISNQPSGLMQNAQIAVTVLGMVSTISMSWFAASFASQALKTAKEEGIAAATKQNIMQVTSTATNEAAPI